MKRILAASLLLLSVTTIGFGQCSESDKQKLIAFDRAWGEAGQRGDRASLQNIYAEEYMNPSPNGTLNKAMSIDNAIREAEQRKTSSQSADTVSHDLYVVTCTPNTATITHRNVITTKANGHEQHFYTRSAHFLEKRGGEWKAVSDAGGPLNDAGQLLYMEMEWSEADQKGDTAWFERNLAADYSGISSATGKLNTKADDIAEIKNRKETIDTAESSDMNVRVEGNTGIVTGIYRLKGRDEKGQPSDRRIRYTDVYAKRDGRWQVIASQGTPIK